MSPLPFCKHDAGKTIPTMKAHRWHSLGSISTTSKTYKCGKRFIKGIQTHLAEILQLRIVRALAFVVKDALLLLLPREGAGEGSCGGVFSKVRGKVVEGNAHQFKDRG